MGMGWLYDGVYGVDHPVLRDHVQLHHPRRAAAAAHPHALAEDVVQAALGADLPRTNQRACCVVLTNHSSPCRPRPP